MKTPTTPRFAFLFHRWSPGSLLFLSRSAPKSLNLGLIMGFGIALIATTNPTVAYQSDFDMGKALIQQLDADGDQAINPYEALDRLLQLESELDGEKITIESLTQLLKDQAEEEREEIAGFLSEMDANSDGKVTLDELDEEAKWFAKAMDANGDGTITLEEASNFDFDDDIFLSAEEVADEVEQIFSELDADKNGVLEPGEADEDFSWEEISEGDSDRNGKVTQAELIDFIQSDNQRAGFTVEEDLAMMKGVINSGTPAEVLRLIHEHPKVRTIVMVNVPGSIDDEANLRAARYVRKFGFKTIIRSNGSVASGGTDFFLAGDQRIVEEGGKLGIHSWGGPGYQGKDVPRDDPQHQLYLKYYDEMGIPGEFYWRTLEAAPANDIHWMTEEEIKEYRVRNPERG